jgi:hypothetical protein
MDEMTFPLFFNIPPTHPQVCFPSGVHSSNNNLNNNLVTPTSF